MRFKTLLSIIAAVLITQVTGCTMIPMTASLDAPVSTSNTSNGQAVKITVTDNRKFVYPHEAGDCVTPSVDGEKMLKDTATQARAFSRFQRCETGEWAQRAMIMVPDGQTIAGLVKNAVAAGFQKAGYRVVDSNDPKAIPVSVEIRNFWVSRQLDGMGGIYETHIALDLTVDSNKLTISEDMSDKIYWDSSSKYQKYAQAGLAKLTDLTDERLKGFPRQ